MSARLPARGSVTAGLPLLLVCLAMLEAALFAKALWLFLAGTVIGGIAVGFIFRGSLSELTGWPTRGTGPGSCPPSLPPPTSAWA